MWSSDNKGLTAASVLTAGLASLCCIGPLAAAAIGAGAFGAAALFESLRPYMLVATGVLLGTAFYLAYRGSPAGDCADGSCVVSPGRKRQRALLWIVAAVAVPLAAFPYYSGLFWGGASGANRGAVAPTSAAAGMADVIFNVEGMTCEGCAKGIQAALAKQAGVTSATVDFEEKTARVVYDPSLVSVPRLTESIAELGFTATLRKDG